MTKLINETVKYVLPGGEEIVYTPNPRCITSVMTTPTEVVRAMAIKCFGHEVAGIGFNTKSETVEISPHVYKTTHKNVTIREGVLLDNGVWSYVNTREVSLDWELVMDSTKLHEATK